MARGKKRTLTEASRAGTSGARNVASKDPRPASRREARAPRNAEPDLTIDAMVAADAESGIGIGVATNETNISYIAGEPFHFVVDGEGMQVQAPGNSMVCYNYDEPTDQQPVADEIEGYATTYGQFEEGEAGNGTFLEEEEETAPDSSAEFTLPAHHVVVVKKNKHDKIPKSSVLYGKYAFPIESQPYTPGERTYTTMTPKEHDEHWRHGRRSVTGHRTLISEGTGINMIEEFQEVERQRVRHVLALSKTVVESRKMSKLIEEENARLNEEKLDFEKEIRDLRQTCIEVVSENEQLNVKIMSNEATGEQKMLWEKKYNEVQDAAKLQLSDSLKATETKLENTRKRNRLLKTKYGRIAKELEKYKQLVTGNAVLMNDLEMKISHTLYGAALAASCPEVLSIIHGAIKLKYPDVQYQDEKNSKIMAIIEKIFQCVGNQEDVPQNDLRHLVQMAIAELPSAPDSGSAPVQHMPEESDDEMVSVHEHDVDWVEPAPPSRRNEPQPPRKTKAIATSNNNSGKEVKTEKLTPPLPLPLPLEMSMERCDPMIESAPPVEELEYNPYAGNNSTLSESESEDEVERKVVMPIPTRTTVAYAPVQPLQPLKEDLSLSDDDSESEATNPVIDIETINETTEQNDEQLDQDLPKQSKAGGTKLAQKKRKPRKKKSKNTLPVNKSFLKELKAEAVKGEAYNEIQKRQRAMRRAENLNMKPKIDPIPKTETEEPLIAPVPVATSSVSNSKNVVKKEKVEPQAPPVIKKEKAEPQAPPVIKKEKVEPQVIKKEKVEPRVIKKEKVEPQGGSSRRSKRVIEKIGDTTIPQPVVGTCIKSKFEHQIDRAKEGKKQQETEETFQEVASEMGKKNVAPVAATAVRPDEVSEMDTAISNPRPLRRRISRVPLARPVETPVPVPSTPSTSYESPKSPPTPRRRISRAPLARPAGTSVPSTPSTSYESPKSPPLASTSAALTNGEIPEGIYKVAQEVLEKHFRRKSVEELNQLKNGTNDVYQSLDNDLSNQPVVMARAIFELMVSEAKRHRRRRQQPLASLVERMEIFIDVLKKTNTGFGVVLLEDFENAISKTKVKALEDNTWTRLGKLYGNLLRHQNTEMGPGSEYRRTYDIIMNCMYWKKERAFAFLHGLLPQFSEPLNMDKNPFNAQNSDVTFRMLLYVLRRGTKGSHNLVKNVSTFLVKSLCHQPNMFEGMGHFEFIEEIAEELKELEEDNAIQRAYKYFGMLCMQFVDWTWLNKFALTQLETLWTEYQEDQVLLTILVSFIHMLGNLVRDMKEVGDIKELWDAVNKIGIGTRDEGVKAAIMDFKEKLDTRSTLDIKIEDKNLAPSKKKIVIGTKRPAAPPKVKTENVAAVQVEAEPPSKRQRKKPARFTGSFSPHKYLQPSRGKGKGPNDLLLTEN